jgi:hypothetical protein
VVVTLCGCKHRTYVYEVRTGPVSRELLISVTMRLLGPATQTGDWVTDSQVCPGAMPQPSSAYASTEPPADNACTKMATACGLMKIYDAEEWADNNGYPPWSGPDGKPMGMQELCMEASGSSPGKRLFTYVGPKGNQVLVPQHPRDWDPKMTQPHRDRVAQSKRICGCSICQLPPGKERVDTFP